MLETIKAPTVGGTFQERLLEAPKPGSSGRGADAEVASMKRKAMDSTTSA